MMLNETSFCQIQYEAHCFKMFCNAAVFAKMLLLNMKKSYNAGVLKAFATKMLKEKLIRYDAH